MTEAYQGILDTLLHLVDRLNHPEHIPILAPMIVREIHYLFLTGPHGENLRMLSTVRTQANRIAQAISWLRENYTDTLNIETLAQ